jgi:methionyl aminopeptidase
MIPLKTTGQIKIMQEGGRRLVWVFAEVLRAIKPGSKLKELDHLAEELIKKQGGLPSFKQVPNYHWATCININQGVVHGIPGKYQIKKGDLVSLDMGLFYQGLHTDMAWTVEVGTQKQKNFLTAGKRALRNAIRAAKAENRVGDISLAIEKEIKKSGFQPIHDLTGHGVGQSLHEEPTIPCFLEADITKTPLLSPGMTLAVEVIYAQGKLDLMISEDGWTVDTADGSLAGLFEYSVAITKKGPLILTRLE